MVLTLLLGAALGAGCSMIQPSHPLVVSDENAPFANVYFIRPRPERTMAMADNTLTLNLDQQPLQNLDKGEYILTRLRPGQMWLTLATRSTFGPEHRMKKITKTRSFTFAAGKTYFIAIRPVDGEFRGVYYQAENVTAAEAQLLVKRASASGLARHYKIQ